jgi:hypothetical protein
LSSRASITIINEKIEQIFNSPQGITYNITYIIILYTGGSFVLYFDSTNNRRYAFDTFVYVCIGFTLLQMGVDKEQFKQLILKKVKHLISDISPTVSDILLQPKHTNICRYTKG